MPAPKATDQRIAVLSDIHGNLVALQAVLAEIAQLGIPRVIVAGDMIGFGPNPDAVVDLLVERGAEMIRGNHEQDYVAVYDTAARPVEWQTSPRWGNLRWTLERLGPERRAFLARLPDQIRLDDFTLVVHGSPRSARDAVLAETPTPELEAMFAGDPARLVLMGHTHRSLVRDIASRRLVNVGSVGMPLDGDPRAGYAVLCPSACQQTTIGEVILRRVPYDLDAAVAAYANGLAESDPFLVPIMIRQVQTGRSYFAPWLRLSQLVADEDLPEALRRFLAARR